MLAAFFLWGVASHAFGAVQDIVADREGGIASIATVIGGAATVRFAFVAYLLGGVLMLFTDVARPAGRLLVLPYALSVLPYWSIADADAERAQHRVAALPAAQFRVRIRRDHAADLAVGACSLSLQRQRSGS